MNSLKELKVKLSQLEARAAEITECGDAIENPSFWLDSTGNGKTSKVYYRKRWFDAEGHKHSEGLTTDAYSDLKTAIAHGKELTRLKREIDQVTTQINKTAQIVASLGFSTKNLLGDRDATCEWYTPVEYIKLSRQVLGEIDLDPASNATAQAWIQAKQFYTAADNGLIQPWHGRVWCNPPYGTPECRLMARSFLERAIACHQKGEITAAILLLNRTGAAWYLDLLKRANSYCQVRRRITFLDQEGEPQNSPRYYNDFIYLGGSARLFESVFSAIGTVHSSN